MQTREIKYLRPEQIRAELDQTALAYLPIGPLEWHGPHLPVGTDPLNAEQAALRAAELTGGVVFPTLFFGTERERSDEMLGWLGFEPGRYIVGMDFPANTLPSAYTPEEIFGLVVSEQLRLIIRLGFKRVVLLSGHGATNQVQVLKRLAAQFSAESPARVLVLLPFVTGEDGMMLVGHASQVETALMMAVHPGSVAIENLPALPQPLKNVDWAVVDFATFEGHPTPDHTVHAEDDPRLATPEIGRQTAEQAAEQIAGQVSSCLLSD